MKILRFINLLALGVFALAPSTVSPVAAPKSVAGPPLQAGVTLTAIGQYCGSATGQCIPWSFSFDPEGGAIGGSIDGRIQRDVGNGETWTIHVMGDQSGYFEGGDGGKVRGHLEATDVDETTGTAPGQFSIEWEGNLYSNGTGKGTGEDANWNVTFDSRAFTTALGSETGPKVDETPTDVMVTTREVQLDQTVRGFIAATLPLNQATAVILNQDSVILARDDNNNFYAVSNQGKALPLPSQLSSVFQLYDHFGILGDDRLLASSEHSSIRGSINGGGDFVYLNKIPGDLKDRDYAMLTTPCSSTSCQSQMRINSTASSVYIQGGALDTGAQQVCKIKSTGSEPFAISSLLSSEHSSIRGSINGGG